MSEFIEIIDNIEALSFDSQAILIDIINKRFADKKKERFIRETLDSVREIEDDNYHQGSSEDLFKELSI